LQHKEASQLQELGRETREEAEAPRFPEDRLLSQEEINPGRRHE
jgi:hypothetical protein